MKEFIEKETNSSDGLMMPENLPPVNVETWIAEGEIIDDEEAEDMDQTD